MGVVIEGLRDFVKALEEVDKKYPEAVRKANYDVARQLIVAARAEARSVPNGVARKAARSLRAGRAADAATVTGGGPNYGFFFGAEFGAKKYRRFEPWRGNQWGGWSGGPGYFLHPTIREKANELVAEYVRTLDELYSKAFPE